MILCGFPFTEKRIIMARVILRFYEELNFHLPEHLRKKDFELERDEESSILSIIEGLGVPSAEVDLILAKGQSVDFGYVPCNGDRISIYPVFESIDIAEIASLPRRPLRSTRFVIDSGLEVLANHMRALGYDVRVGSFGASSEVINISKRERRIILTSNPELLQSDEVSHAILLVSDVPEMQLQEILDRVEIHPRTTG